MNFNSEKIFPAGWQLKTIGEVCLKVTSGGTPSRTKPEFYVNGTWPWVKTKELADGWVDTTEEFITEDAVAKSSAKVLPAETVLMAMYGATVGQLGILREPMTCNQACCAMIVDEQKADFRYLYYLLLLHREQIRSIASGAAQQNLSGQQIKQLVFAFPLPAEQGRIAHILGTLDDKIELNRRQNETLESLARALFQSWFVDFDPVRAKASGETEAAICQRLGLSPQVLALFPAALEKSALGEVPVGWEVGPFSKLADFVNKPIKPFDKPEKVWEHFSLPAFDANQTPSFENGSTIKSGKFAVPTDAVLVSKLNPRIPRIWLPNPETTDAIASTEFMPFVARKAGEQTLVYCLVTSGKFQAEFMQRVKGSTGSHQRVGPTDILKIPVVIPDSDTRHAFITLIQPFLKKQAESLAESRTLAALRNELLPRLLSGELSVNL